MGGWRWIQRLAQSPHALHRFIQRDQHGVHGIGGLRKIHSQKLEPKPRGGKQGAGLVMQDAARVTKLTPSFEEFLRQALGFAL